MGDSKEKLLPVEKDSFNCVNFHSNKLSVPIEAEFEERLNVSLHEWKSAGIRSVNFKILLQHSSLVPICAKHGFVFHHAQPNYVLMTRWLPDDEPNTFPAYANQYLGAGGFVVNEKQQVLVIQEKFHTNKHWKLPGGLADPGEDIGTAAEREVFEETGIRCQFQSVICFRHQHNFRFGCSDFYFICLMRPLSEDITQCPHEIFQCRWMNLNEYLNHPDTSPANAYFAERYIALIESGRQVSIRNQPVISYNKERYTQVYSILHDEAELQPVNHPHKAQ